MPRHGRSLIDILEGGLVTILQVTPSEWPGAESKLPVQISGEDSKALYLIAAHGYFVTPRCIVTVNHLQNLVVQDNGGKPTLNQNFRLAYRGHRITANVVFYDRGATSDCALIGLDEDILCHPLLLGIGAEEDERAKYIAYSSLRLKDADWPSKGGSIPLDRLNRAAFDVNGQIGSARSQDRLAPTMTFYSFQNNDMTNLLGTSGTPVLSADGFCLGHVQSRLRPPELSEATVNDASTQRGIQYICPAEYVVRLSSGVLPHRYRRVAYKEPLHRLRSLTTLLLDKRELNILILSPRPERQAETLLNQLSLGLKANLQNYTCNIEIGYTCPQVFISDIILIPAVKREQRRIEQWINKNAEVPQHRFAVIMQVDVDGSGPGFLYPSQHQPLDISPSRQLSDADAGAVAPLLTEVAFRIQWYILNGLDLAA